VKDLWPFVVLVLIVLFLTNCESGETSKVVKVNQDTVALSKKWEIAIPNQEVPEGLTSLSSKDCGVCHQEHYKEWKTSTHAHAWTDLQFQSELKKESSPLMCINCHIPLQNQQEFIVTGLINGDIYQPVKKINPHFDKDLQNEGINCASCHVRNGAIVGPTGTAKAPHKTVKGTVHLSEELCTKCHNATAVITPTLACTFETGDEWQGGPYAAEKNCISCHMPEINREVVAGYGKRKSRHHYFMGSGIPKLKGLQPQILNGLVYYPSKIKEDYMLNDSLNFSFKIVNENAGHKVPTGDPERFIIFSFHLIHNGIVIAEKTERIGEEWEWYPEAKKLSDNNLNPLEERVYTFNPKIKSIGEYTLAIEVTKHRMNEETAKYNKLGEEYPLFISIYNKEFDFIVK